VVECRNEAMMRDTEGRQCAVNGGQEIGMQRAGSVQ